MRKLLFLIIVSFLYSNQLKAVDFYIKPTVTAPVSGCMLSDTADVTVVIGNAGLSTVDNHTFYVSYSVGGVTVTEEYIMPAGWSSNATYIYTFRSRADLSECKKHFFVFELSVAGDTDLTNNTLNEIIISDCNPIVGAITGPAIVCDGINSDSLFLEGYEGNINKWELSNNSGVSWTSISNITDTAVFTNLTLQTDYRVIIESLHGFCLQDTTLEYTILIETLSEGGEVNPNQNICSNGNEGVLVADGFLGDVVEWQFLIDGGISWNTVANTNDTLLFADELVTVQYQVLIKNGVCPSVLSTTAELTIVPGSYAGTILGKDTVCNAQVDSLLTLDDYNGDIMSWIYSSDDEATWFHTDDTTINYSYAALFGYTVFGAIVKENNCPNDTTFHPIIVLPTDVSGGPNLSIIEGDSIQLHGSGGVSYYWTPPLFIDDDTSQTPVVWPVLDMTYSVEVTDVFGCKDTAFVIIKVNPDLEIVTIPNLLTPNGDGYNDVWEILNIATYVESEVMIFNSYGNVIFQASPYLNDWDAKGMNGKTLPDGSYFYIVNLGEDFEPIKGVLTLVSKE